VICGVEKLMERIRHALGVFAIVVHAPGLLYWFRLIPRR